MFESLMQKKTLLAGLLVIVLAFTLAACDADTTDPGVDDNGAFQQPLATDDGFLGDDSGDVVTDTFDLTDEVTGTEEMTGTDDMDTDDDAALDDSNEEGVDDPLDDSDEVGIVWEDDEFELKGYVVGAPDLVSNTLTVDANGEEYTVWVGADAVFEDELLLEDLMDGDMVEIEGMRDEAGDLWATLIEREDDSDLSDS
jgi:hypothetical protein